MRSSVRMVTVLTIFSHDNAPCRTIAFTPKKGPRVIAKAFHMQTVNNLRSRFETFMKPFCGPATENLPAYAAWFVSRLVGDQQDAENAAWQIALAA